MTKQEFDRLDRKYKESITPWMHLTGESIDFYSRSRIKWVAKQLGMQGCHPREILDFGYGIGLATPLFLEEFGDGCKIVGVDVSMNSIKRAKSQCDSQKYKFLFS
jgi:ubiquinone/menaquinone biosynthesis C-methylase UbiE